MKRPSSLPVATATNRKIPVDGRSRVEETWIRDEAGRLPDRTNGHLSDPSKRSERSDDVEHDPGGGSENPGPRPAPARARRARDRSEGRRRAGHPRRVPETI